MKTLTAKELLVKRDYLTNFDESKFLEEIMKEYAAQFIDLAANEVDERSITIKNMQLSAINFNIVNRIKEQII